LDRIRHAQVNIGHHKTMLELVDLLVSCLPGKLDTLFFSTTGAEAVENAAKLLPGVLLGSMYRRALK
jgi:adenosylmethionine-8-amino-7-oxononanoate aminotransferase